MNSIHKLVSWGDQHQPKILDLIRMVLGLLLLVKGIVFLNKGAYLRDLIIGLFTRLASLLQLPIVFGAVFFVNILSSFVNSELWLSVLVLALLVMYVFIGSGPLSLDRLIREYADEAKNESGFRSSH